MPSFIDSNILDEINVTKNYLKSQTTPCHLSFHLSYHLAVRHLRTNSFSVVHSAVNNAFRMNASMEMMGWCNLLIANLLKDAINAKVRKGTMQQAPN